MKYVTSLLDNIVKHYAHTGMTGEAKETADYDFDLQQRLNEEEFDRKKEFFELYESPEAQVRQYKSAGLNPALMFGNGASVSASGGIGSAGSVDVPGPSGGDLSGIIQAVIGIGDLKRRKRQQSIDAGFEATRLRQADDQIQINKQYQHNYGLYLAAVTRGKEIENENLPRFLELRNENLEKDSALKDKQAGYFTELCNSEDVRRRLMESGIRLNDVTKAGQLVQNSILRAQEKYSDEYFAAVKKYQEAVSSMAEVDASIYEKTKDRRLKAAEAELCQVIIRAGMDARLYEGEAFEKMVEGKMNSKEKTEFLGSIIRATITAGTAAAVAALKFSAKAVTPPMTPGMQSQVQSYFSPYENYAPGL